MQKRADDSNLHFEPKDAVVGWYVLGICPNILWF